MIPPHEAFQRLKEGNQRFLSGVSARDTLASQARRQQLVSGQKPFAVILACADSRIPPEVLFDQGLGDLFVVRIAGNIAASSQIGSLEYAVTQLRTHLIVVMGHTGCGAIAAAVEQILDPSWQTSPHLQKVIDYIRPSLAGEIPEDLLQDGPALAEYATRKNVDHVLRQLPLQSEVLSQAAAAKELAMVGAEYNLETGVVEFFNHVRAPSP